MSREAGTSRYGLRALYIRRGFEEDQPSVSKDGTDAATEACIAVGLKGREMTKQERQLFGTRMHDYLKARNKILVQWYQDCTKAVTLLELLDEADDKQWTLTRDAYFFLQENGYINFGVLQGSSPPEAPAVEDQAGQAAAAAAAAAEPAENDRTIVFKLYELLRAADMQTTSEKAIRKQLQQHFKTDISEKKALVKQHVNYFIQHLEDKDKLEPLGYEGQTEQHAAQQAQEEQAKAAARAAAAAPPPKPSGRVIIVGAGPAGLAAATLLQRNQVEVCVVEARDRVGGRVHSYTGPFAAPVDLGASLITGTAADVHEGLAPDPVSLICKQLNISLHRLDTNLPIYTSMGQQVAPDVDAAADKLRDGLLDAALDRIQQGDEQQLAMESLGSTLTAALQHRLQAPTAAVVPAAVMQTSEKGPAADVQANGTHPVQAEAGGEARAAVGSPGQQAEPKADAAEASGDPGQLEAGHPAAAAAGSGQPMANGDQPAAADGDAAEGGAGEAQSGPPASSAAEPATATATTAAPAPAAAAAAAAVTPEMLEMLDWHWANLEYGCSASLSELSLLHWNQDEEWGGFGGPHCMVVGGFDQALEGLAAQLGDALRLSCPVSRIEYNIQDEEQQKEQQEQDGAEEPLSGAGQGGSSSAVRVTLTSGEVMEGSLVLVTVPLGVLKAGGVEFVPQLPDWKVEAVQRLGFGDLNKVVMQFPHVFWRDVDYFGITQPGGEEGRGRCFMFWNLARFNQGLPLLTSLLSGRAARAAETQTIEELQEQMMQALRRVYGEVPEPVAVHTTRWASEEFSRGSYSFVAVGSSGRDYDTLALPVARRVLFAGEHTCKEHPDTVGGALLSGLREGARALQLLRGPAGAAAADLVLSRTETLSKTDKRKRLQEEATAGEDDDEVSEGRKKKRKKDKHKEKKEKKEKRHKEKKEKKKNKDKEAAAAESDDGRSDEETKDRTAAGQRGRERRAAGMTAEDMVARATAREHLRHDLTRLWRGLIAAGATGDMGVVNDVLTGCSTLDERQQSMAVLLRSQPAALQACAQDALFLGTLNSWLSELVGERSDANLHVLRKLLEVLQKLPAASYAVLQAAGLLVSIDKACKHRHRDVAQTATAIAKDWAARNPTKGKPPVQQRSAASSGAVGRKLAVLQLPLLSDSDSKQQFPEQKQQQQQPPPKPHQSAQHQAGVVDAGAAAAAESDAAMVDLLAPGERQALQAAEAAMREAQAQAEAAAAQLAEMQEQQVHLPRSGAGLIASFGEFKRGVKRQQQDDADEARELLQESKATKRSQQDSQHQQQHRHRKEQPTNRNGAAAPGHHRKASQDGPSEAAAAAAAAEPVDPKEKATKQLRDYVKAQLKPRFQAKELDTDDCKWVLAKVVEKVMANTSALEAAGTANGFMTAKRQKKVAAVIDSYADRRKKEK